MNELYQQLEVLRRRLADLYQCQGCAPQEQIERLAAAFLAFSQSWEQLYSIQGQHLTQALTELSELWRLLYLAHELLQEQEEALMLAHEQVQAQQRRYQDILELIPDAYLVTNSHGIIQEANLQAARLLHRTQQFLLGKPISLFVCEQEQQPFYQQIKQLLQNNQTSPIHQDWRVCLLRPKHEQFEVTLSVTTSCEPGSGNVILHWFVRGAVAAQLSEEPGRTLEVIVQHLQEAIVITTPNLDLPGPQVIFVNATFTQMTGYSLEEMLGKTPRILQVPETERATLKQLRQTLEQGHCFEGEATNYHKDGTPYRVQLRCIPVQNQRGDVTHFVSVQSHLKFA